MSTINLPIQGMTCQGCVAAATRAIRSVPGVATVQVSLTPGAAAITLSPDADQAACARIATAVSAAITKAGFIPG